MSNDSKQSSLSSSSKIVFTGRENKDLVTKMESQLKLYPASLVEEMLVYLLPRDVMNLSMVSTELYKVSCDLCEVMLHSATSFCIRISTFSSSFSSLLLCSFHDLKICNSNEVWKNIFDQHLSAYCVNEDFQKLIHCDSWKFFCYRIFLRNHDNPNLHHLFCDKCETISAAGDGKSI